MKLCHESTKYYPFQINSNIDLSGRDAVNPNSGSCTYILNLMFYHSELTMNLPFRTATPALTTPSAACELIV